MKDFQTVVLVEPHGKDGFLVGAKWVREDGKGWGEKGEGKTLEEAHANLLKALQKAVNEDGCG